jgi:hypothetical protein
MRHHRQRAAELLRALMLISLSISAGAADPADSVPAAQVTNQADDLTQAERDAAARHTRALRACSTSANYAACVRDADAALHDTRRGLTGERQRGATPPGGTAQDVPRVQGGRLIRELEQAAPRPPLAPPANPDTGTPPR